MNYYENSELQNQIRNVGMSGRVDVKWYNVSLSDLAKFRKVVLEKEGVADVSSIFCIIY